MLESNNSINDIFWKQVLDYDNLLLAWARARNEILGTQWDDSLELKLFEANIEGRIKKLQNDITHYLWDELMIKNTLNYAVPKGGGQKPRPMSLGRIQDQILSVAFLQQLTQRKSILAPSTQHKNSYAYRMRKDSVEVLFESWWDAYIRYIDGARKVATNLPSPFILRTDLSSFFTTINHDTLIEMLRQFADITGSRSLTLVDYLIRRDCGLESEGLGLPQGHSWSGVLANIYLHSVDKCFEDGLGLRCQYFRYVDDIIIVYDEVELKDHILGTLDSELGRLGLKRSEQKTRLYTEHDEFLSETAIDEALDGLGKKHRSLMARLYKLNRKGRATFLDNPQVFASLYSLGLANNEIYLAPDRLLRKIHQYLNYLRNIFSGTWFDALRLPGPKLLEPSTLIEWSQHHQALNKEWYLEIESHRQQLVTLLIQSIEAYNPKADLKQPNIRQIRFSAYRLSQLGYDGALPFIVEFIKNNPELLNLRIVLTSIGRQSQEGALLDLMGHFSELPEPEFAYIRSQILRGFRYLPTQSQSTINTQLDLIYREHLSTLELTTLSENLVFCPTIDISEEQILLLSQKSNDPYVQKNLIFLRNAKRITFDLMSPGDHPLLIEASEYSRINPDLDHLFNLEPQILYDSFYAYEYPDNFDEFPEHPSAVE